MLLWLIVASLSANAAEIDLKAVRIVGNRITHEAVIRHYLALPPGRMEEQALTRRVRLAQQRLESLQVFYQVRIHVLPGQQPTDRMVICEVQEGYRMRFGGGNAFAKIGQENAFGRDAAFLVTLGYYPIELRYEERLLAGLPIYASSKARFEVAASRSRYLPSSDDATYRMHEGIAELETGVYAGPDLRIGAFGGLTWFQISDRSTVPENELVDALANTELPSAWELERYGGPHIAWGRYDDPWFPTRGSRADLRIRVASTHAVPYASGEVDTRAYLPLHPRLSAALRAFASAGSPDLPFFRQYALSDAGFVRAPWSSDLGGVAAALGSFELRSLVASVKVLSSFKIEFRPAVFVDVAVTSPDLAEGISGRPVVMTAGPALRFFVPEPAYVPFRFELGLGPEGVAFFFSTDAVF